MLIIGVRKQPKEASCTLLILTEYMKPNQLVAINKEVIVNIIIFFDDLNIEKNSLISLKKISDRERTKKDQAPLCIATSKDGIYFISSKKSG